ncbi:MAB_1171c family putative transporter [Actinosynnema sp. NPDC091369]
MKAKELRELRDGLIRELDLDGSATTEAVCVRLCEVVARRMRREIVLRFEDLGAGGTSGLWAVTEDEVHVIIVTTARSWVHRLLILTHEIAHMLCGHRPPRLDAEEGRRLLFPDLSPAMLRILAGRTDLSRRDEREADRVAGVLTRALLDRAGRQPHEPARPDGDDLATRAWYTFGYPSGATVADVQYLLSALGVLALLAHKYRAYRRAPPELRPAVLPICLACVTAAPAFVFLAPVVGQGVDRLTGVPNLSVLLVYGFGVAFVAANQAMLLYWRHPPARAWRTTRRVLVASAFVLGAVVALFALGSPDEEHHGDFPVAFADTPYLAELLVLYHVTYLAGMLNVARLCRLWADETPPDQPWLRRGLRLNAVGVLIGSVYAVLVLVAVVGRWVGAELDAWGVAAPRTLTLAVPVVVIGASIAAWGPRLTLWRERVTRVRDAVRDHAPLRPLWRALRAVDPTMRHVPVTPRERFDPEHRLFWRVIEINDWLHRLRAGRDPVVADAVARRAAEHGAGEQEVRAATEAAWIKAALAARARGVTTTGEAPSDQDEPLAAEHAFAGERTWLVLVAEAFDGRVVADALADADRATAPGRS